MSAPYTLAPDEKIIHEVHKHPVSLLAPFAVGLLCIGLVPFIPFIIGGAASLVVGLPGGALATLTGVLMAALMLIGLLIMWMAYTLHHKSRLIITDQNLVVIEQKGLFNRRVVQMALMNLEDVKSSRTGMLATMFDYGSVEIQTASEDDARFTHAPHPAMLVDECLQAQEDFFKTHPERG